ncbi:MAG TPA: SpoIVB peptidase S55 domain-containing protein [Pyrinomonadaceae bacterium]|nr:SpoIVB peptidase S55 domain-containing protein [Pyrinomonadaceae bacterium]
MKAKIFASLLIISAFCLNIFGQTQAKSDLKTANIKTPAVQFFPLSELKEGMRGTARTVFRGSEPEEFQVEILGIVPGAVGPKQDMIVGRISGGSADRTSVFAGMSGSPVYIDGKLVGAISYSFPFSKEPICGITPIAQMLDIFEQKQNLKMKAKEPRAFSFAELASIDWKPNFPNNATVSSSILANASANSPLNALLGQSFQPIATPISFSGFSQETLNRFAPQLVSVGLFPVSAVGGAARISPLKVADEATLQGGASVSMQLTRGDYSLAASGTVTMRDGYKIYAFGHPFLSLGTSDLPMSESSVVTVIPSVANSFKLAVPSAMVGTMTQDRATGVFGKLGQSPKMIPVKINLETSRNGQETLNFEVVKDEFLTPLLLNMTVYNSIVANERGLGDSMIELKGEIKLKNQQTVKLERRFTGMQASQIAASSVAVPVNALLDSRFDNVEITEINLNLSSSDGSKTATLERIALDRTEVKAGETFEVQAFVRTDTGKVFSQKIPVQIPSDTPSGKLLVTVADGGSLQYASASRQFVPKDLKELVKTINEIRKNDRLYVQTYRVTNGAVIGASELPNLPPSMLATLNNDRTAGGFKPTLLTVLTEQELAPAEFIVSGQQVLTIEVTR